MPVYPSTVFSKENIKARWEERYTSEAINQKFLGLPRGVYAGFRPQVSSLLNTQLDLTVEPGDGYSLIRVQSSSENVMVDIITDQTVSLDFTGHSIWPIFIIATANYQVGSDSVGALITQSTPATSPQQVTVCKVDRPGNTGPIIPSPTNVFPTDDVVSRQEPYAFGNTTTLVLASVTGVPAVNDVITTGSSPVKTGIVARVGANYTSVDIVLDTPPGSPFLAGAAVFEPFGATANIISATVNDIAQRFGFMPKGSKQQLDVAYTTAQEVVAARAGLDGNSAPIFDPNNAQTTGLPARLTQDLRTAALAARLGLKTINTRSNGYTLPGVTVDITVASGTGYVLGDLVHASVGSPQPIGVIRAISTNTLTVHTLQGVFTTGNLIDNAVNVLGSGPGSATSAIVSIATKFLNVSGSFSARRRGNLGLYPFAELSTDALVTNPKRTVINPTGTEDSSPGPTGIHTPIEGAITDSEINSIILTVAEITAPGPISNPVDGFLPGEKVSFRDITNTEVGIGLVSELRFPYLVTTFVSGVTTGTVSVLGYITGTTAVVSSIFTNLITDTIRNTCFIARTDTGERYTVPNVSTTNTDIVYGRLRFVSRLITPGPVSLPAQGLLPGTFSFQSSSANVNTSQDVRGYLDIGDIIGAPNGRWYEIVSMTSSQVVLHEAYVGTTALTTPKVVVRKITMEFFTRSLPTGTEAPYSIAGSSGLPPLQFFFPSWVSELDSNYDASINMLTPGEPTLPDASTTIKGKAILAPNTTGGSNTANDTKVGMIANVTATGAPVGGVTGNYHTLNFITSAGNITQPSPGVVSIAATGPPGPPGPPGPTGGGGGSGPPGPAGVVANPMVPSSSGTFLVSINNVSPGLTQSFNFGFTPTVYQVSFNHVAPQPDLDTGWITGIAIVGTSVIVTYSIDDAGSSSGHTMLMLVCAAG